MSQMKSTGMSSLLTSFPSFTKLPCLCSSGVLPQNMLHQTEGDTGVSFNTISEHCPIWQSLAREGSLSRLGFITVHVAASIPRTNIIPLPCSQFPMSQLRFQNHTGSYIPPISRQHKSAQLRYIGELAH